MYLRSIGKVFLAARVRKLISALKYSLTPRVYRGISLLFKKSGDNQDKSVAAKAITKEVNIYFTDRAEWEENVTLDKFMVDADIKDFVIKRLGCHSWDNLSTAELGCVYFN
jgi:hypothetical protein